MKVAELILEYIRVLAYPCLLLVIFFALKNQLSDLIERIKSGKWGDFSVEIGERNEAMDQSTILDYIKKSGGRLSLKELYRETEKRVSYKQLQKEKRRIGAAIEGLAQRGIIVKDMEGNINVT